MFKVGDLVVPISKSALYPLEDSHQWDTARRKGQPYLHVVRLDTNYSDQINGGRHERVVVCNVHDESYSDRGDVFLESDLLPFNIKDAMGEYVRGKISAEHLKKLIGGK